jgi:hypothetical protein
VNKEEAIVPSWPLQDDCSFRNENRDTFMHDDTLHFERILAAISFRDKAVARRATAVARWMGLRLRLVHIDELSSPTCRSDSTPTSSDRLESSRLAASMIDCGTPVEAVNLAGNPRRTLSALPGNNEVLMIGSGHEPCSIGELSECAASIIWDLKRPVLVVLHRDEDELICAISRHANQDGHANARILANMLSVELRVLNALPVAQHLPCECYYG